MRRWSQQHGLQGEFSSGAAAPEPEQEAVPRAPHLQDCTLLTGQRRRLDERDASGTLPEWAADTSPPWICGSDADNLPLTRRSQTDIWLQQHPPNCSAPSVKFGIVEWVGNAGHGSGSQLHIMSGAISEFLRSKRVVVLVNNWERAQHPGCPGNSHGRLSCYFWPETSEDCYDVALAYYTEHKAGMASILDKHVLASISSQAQFVIVPQSTLRIWGRPWRSTPVSTELLGTRMPLSDVEGRMNWWRSQSIRYMMRWPSQSLCDATNRARHEVYGLLVALEVVTAVKEQRQLLQMVKTLQNLTAMPALSSVQSSLDSMHWQDEEAYIPRPIASINVRQGDKAREMRLYAFAAFMWYAYRLRYRIPDLRHLWLSTEMQKVIENTSKHRRWSFFFTRVPRQSGFRTSMQAYEQKSGVETMTANAFANLLIASECDYFIGVLGSNWNRLINELRLTNGRLSNGCLTLNYADV
eukprot:SM000001S04766  [mRNA]  locus=s1:2067475:2069984:- [translate_table: standard]